jgi:opacity protein-like surface antigen
LPAGYAQTGYCASIGFCYDITPFVGITMQYQYTQHPFNNDKILSDLKASSASFEVDHYHSNPWKLQGLMLGIYYPFKSAKTTIDVRALGILNTALLPESEEHITVPSLNNRSFNFKQFENSSANIGFQGGIKIRYKLYQRITLSSGIDYTYTKVKFQDIKVIETYSNSRVSADDYTQVFQYINFSVGLGVQFD